jgi:hypothetical protein
MTDEWSLSAATRKKPANFNAMTEKLLRKSGWEVELTQSFNGHSTHSKDLWNFGDLIAFVPNQVGVVIIQACGSPSRADRYKKILSNAVAYQWVLSPHRSIWLVHWSKPTLNGKRSNNWDTRIEIITEEEFKYFHRTKEVPPCP